MKQVSSKKAVKMTLENIKNRTPAYSEIIDRFSPLFLLKANLRDALIKKQIKLPKIAPAKLSAGVPILAGKDISLWTKEFVEVAGKILPTLTEALEIDKKNQTVLHDFLINPDNLLGLAQARIDGNWKHFENTSEQLGISPDHILLYISENVCTPVFSAIAELLGKSLSDDNWDQGNCPICGSSPSISHLSPIEVTDLDQLVGGGGKKYLHCSLCGHDWRFKRNACSACGNDENESREIFYVDDIKYERIEACHKCETYCLSIDMREYEVPPQLDVAQLGLIHLDMYACNNKLRPITATLWNTLD